MFRRLPDLVRHLRAHLPRGTVRTRLTILYSSVFLLCGAALLAITYQLVEHSTDRAVYTNRGTGTSGKGSIFHRNISGAANLHPITSQVARVQTNDLHQLLIKSGIALAIMAVVAVAAGYFVAGRILRPLHRITTTARGISAGNLHARLAMTGPHDELTELGDTFDDLLSRLEASFKSQRQFVANASHELRSPLTRLRLLAEVAATDSEATVESLQDAHHRVIAAAEQQEQLLDALFCLAQSQGGLDCREPLDLSAVVNDVLLAARPEPERQTLRIEACTDRAPMIGDRHLVERLVGNLVDNAMRYNVPSGHVRVATGVVEGSAALDISNSGPVVPSTEVDRLFRPFQRLEPLRRHHQTGHGLGLSIVKEIATAHGTVITTSARREGGLRIQVRFPSADPEIAPETTVHHHLTDPSSPGDQSTSSQRRHHYRSA
jgi:signal transduction histidine kinase